MQIYRADPPNASSGENPNVKAAARYSNMKEVPRSNFVSSKYQNHRRRGDDDDDEAAADADHDDGDAADDAGDHDDVYFWDESSDDLEITVS